MSTRLMPKTVAVSAAALHASPRTSPLLRFFILVIAALGAALPAAWGAAPVFTLGNNVFPSTALGQSITQNVTLTLNAAVAIQSIALGGGFKDY